MTDGLTALTPPQRAKHHPSGDNPGSIPGAKRAPMPRQIDVPLATLKTAVPRGDDWLHEIKYDGYRMLARIEHAKATFVTRNHHNWTEHFPELAKAVAGLPTHAGVVLDGEIVKFDTMGVSRFSALQHALSTKETGDLAYVVFDVPYLAGYDLRDARLEDRKELLRILLRNAPPSIRYSEHRVGGGPAFLRAACARRLEGIVSKGRASHYIAGRGLDWIKAKCFHADEFVIVGFTDPQRSRVGFGALLVGYYTPDGELVYGGKVGTGYDREFLLLFRKRLDRIERREPTTRLPKGIRMASRIHWVNPDYVAQIGFTEWTCDKFLRHPRFLGLREDKAPEEVVIDRRPR